MSKRVLEQFHFDSLEGLRDFLNGFTHMNLDAVHPNNSDYITLDWIEETLSDGSTANNVDISTHEQYCD